MHITIPRVFAIDGIVAGNQILQIGEPGYEADGNLTAFSYGRHLHGHSFQPNNGGSEVLIFPKSRGLPNNHERIIQANIDPNGTSLDLTKAVWAKHPSLNLYRNRSEQETQVRQVIESWNGSFSYVEENRASGVIGLRPPQLGALHAIRSHWFVSDLTATIVMPTGTGKTETMLSTMVSIPCAKVLVIVPTDALRAQLAEKFATLGILKLPGCALLGEATRNPVVCILRHIPSLNDVDEICARSNVIVTTSSIAAQCGEDVQAALAERCPYLFVDEAHHAEAPTWKEFKQKFRDKKILQFTATPFREDGKPLDGDIIFKYPLKKAQEEEFFRPIRFEPVIEFNRQRADRAICERAIARLRIDAPRGHILMARVDSVARAAEVFRLYEPYAEFNPVQLHTGIKSHQRRTEIRNQIISGHSKIVVCVDMLGEGFQFQLSSAVSLRIKNSQRRDSERRLQNHVSAVSWIFDVGKPFDFGRHFGQSLNFCVN